MSQYKYVSVLEVQSDGQPPNDNIEQGDKIVKAGKHETDSIQYMAESGDIDVVEFEQVAIYESDEKMSQKEAEELARERWFAEDNE